MKNNKSNFAGEPLLSVLEQQGCGIISINEAGLITDINTTAERLTGWSAAEALHQEIGLVYGADFGDTAKNGSLSQYILEDCCENTPSSAIELTSLSGRKYMVNHAATPLLDQSSRLIGTIISFRDITSSLEVEGNLTRSNNTLQSIVDHFPLPMGAKNLNGQFTIINEAFAELLGRTKEGCLNQPRGAVFPGGTVALHKEKDQEVLQTASPIKYEFSLVKGNSPNPSGEQKCVLTKFPMFNNKGEIYSIGFICNKLFNTSLKQGPSSTQGVTASSNQEPVDAPPRIMVVDDDIQMRELTKEILEIEGFEVICPRSATLALKQLNNESHTISLLITDIMMPELDGYQLAEKALALNPNLKIILASGFNSYLAEKNPLKSLPKINKPYPSQQLLELVSTLLDSTIDKKSIPTP